MYASKSNCHTIDESRMSKVSVVWWIIKRVMRLCRYMCFVEPQRSHNIRCTLRRGSHHQNSCNRPGVGNAGEELYCKISANRTRNRRVTIQLDQTTFLKWYALQMCSKTNQLRDWCCYYITISAGHKCAQQLRYGRVSSFDNSERTEQLKLNFMAVYSQVILKIEEKIGI